MDADFGGLSCLFNVIASIEVNRKNISYCNDNNNCYELLLPIAQLISPWITGLIFYAMYIFSIMMKKILIKLNLIHKFLFSLTYSFS